MSDVFIRKMEVSDLDQVLEVEHASFATPWPREIFQQELEKNNHAHYFVMIEDDKIIGYAGVWIVFEDAQITNIAILPHYRGRKLGESLFYYVMKYGIQMGMERLSLEVRVSNIIAQKMYRKFGLVPGGIRRNYYTDNNEDAIVMWVNV